MTEPSDVTFVADALLEEGGRVDALLAAVVGILQGYQLLTKTWPNMDNNVIMMA
jgi:hypothetical protein